MFTFIKSFVNSYKNYDKDQINLEKQLEDEQRFFDKQIENEIEASDDEHGVNNDAENNANQAKNTDGSAVKGTNCGSRTGIVTMVGTNGGVIDNSICFGMDLASGLFNDLKIGSRVEYLSYEQADNDHIKLIKINQIIDDGWDHGACTQEKIDLEIAELRQTQPKYFNTNQRNILGLITTRKPSSIIIDTDYKSLDVSLDEIDIDFVPQEGDRVYMCCNVQIDEDYVDQQGEILEVISVHASRILKEELCTVRRVCDDWGVLNDDCYFTFDILPNACKLNVGQIVNADLIECDRGQFVWRCLKLCPTNQTIAGKSDLSNKTKNASSNLRTDNHAVVVSPDQRCIFSNTFERQELRMTISNKTERTHVCSGVEILGRRRESQLNLIQPDPGTIFELKPHATQEILFEIESRFYGETREYFVVKFNSFRIKRSITIIVCENEADAADARAKEAAIAATAVAEESGYKTETQRQRNYANQVYFKKRSVIPGVSMCSKRRFVAYRIGFYEVPERLRDTYLSTEKKQNMIDKLEELYPCLKAELSFANYVQRFQTLLFLEEVECFVYFRKYDRDRAHFTREGEYLALVIENLAEQRPSLVIGDTVRAIDPWNEHKSDDRGYDGIIHKVMFNRILLKFHPTFQNDYNGEDYRLEFYFSRFGFRKQHYATPRVVKQLGEKFLFPTKVTLREKPQLDVQLDNDLNLHIKGSTAKSPWYNQTLNEVQKRAICNVLAGEALNMPYVIFGPPGTGKTITMVECLLQIVKHLPNARLLVGTPSNSSADLITTRIIECGVLQAGDFVRVVSLNQIEKDVIPDNLKPYCATVDIGIDGTCENSMIVTDSGLKLKCQMKYLGRHRVTISTCTTLGNFLQMPFPDGHFTHILIDESGQCTETEIMIAISQVSQTRGQVILAGDPMQLQPISINKYAKDRGMSVSFLERILGRTPYAKDMLRFPNSSGYDPRVLTKLLYNYRALPSILSVYNKLFYDSDLLAMISDKNSREVVLLKKLDCLLPKSDIRPKTHGTFFYGMRSENLQGTDSPSWYNPQEAKNVFLMAIQLYRQGIKPEDIGIITPYSKQVKHLRNLFVTSDIGMPKIGSVEEFQGQERDIILVSSVRSAEKYVDIDLRHSLGFVQCPKRMNVAISRARYLLFVFGNPHLLVLDRYWCNFIKYCVDNDAYLGCDLPEIVINSSATNEANESIDEFVQN